MIISMIGLALINISQYLTLRNLNEAVIVQNDVLTDVIQDNMRIHVTLLNNGLIDKSYIKPHIRVEPTEKGKIHITDNEIQ